MTKLSSYMDDGANPQARAVLAYLQRYDGIGDSWNEEFRRYDADIQVARWENCREQGYVVSLRSLDYSKQLNIAFFEHRNSDSIVAVKWEQISINSLTIDTAQFGNIYRDKWDYSHSERVGEAMAMAIWIIDELTEFWIETNKK